MIERPLAHIVLAVPHRFLSRVTALMLRTALVCLAALITLVSSRLTLGQQLGEVLISQSTAERHGLTRAWYAQIRLDGAIGRVTYVTLDRDVLFVQTSHAMLHAINAETGRTIWAQRVGQPRLLSMAPGANNQYVTVINGSTLYLIDRRTGRLQWSREVNGIAGAGPAVSLTRVFVPMINGMIEGYEIDKPKQHPWFYKSDGRILVQPMITPRSVIWTTNKGHFYIGNADEVGVRLRLETRASIEARPAYWMPYVYACSLDGNVYAIDETTGQTAWKFPTGDPISQPPVAIQDRVYAVSNDGGMYQLNGKTGEQLWYAPGITHFISRSPSRVYANDGLNRLAILDDRTGTRLDSLPLGPISLKIKNCDTDRIYLCTQGGQIQCLHELGLAKPVVYVPPAPPEVVASGDKGKKKDAPVKQPPETKKKEPPKKEPPPKAEEKRPVEDDVANPFG